MGGKATIDLSTGPMDVFGHWTGTDESVVVLLTGLKAEQSAWQGLCDALAANGCEVLVPMLPGTAEKELEMDMNALIAFFDWLGLANPVVYGYDWGAIRAFKFKMLHPKRVKYVVAENRKANMNETQAKE